MSELWRRLIFLFRRRQFDREMDEEMRIHLEMKSEEQGHYTARRQFGNITLLKEVSREMWGWTLLETLLQDLRYGLRMLRRSPGFTAVAVLSLALGIGVNTAIFSLIDAVLVKRLPVKDPEQLVSLVPIQRGERRDISYPLYRHLRDRQQVFDAVIATVNWGFVSVRLDRNEESIEPARFQGGIVSGNYFSALGVDAVLGRVFTQDDDRIPGHNPVAVISYEFWKRQFSRNPEALGRTIYLNDVPLTIIGVTPRQFFGDVAGSAPDVWVPAMMQPNLMASTNWLEGRATNWLQVIARLKPGVSHARAEGVATALYRRFIEEDRASGGRSLSDYQIQVEPASQGLSAVRRQFSRPLAVLIGATGLVLLIACCNLAALLLARASYRQREIGIRLALGSSRLRLIRQLLTESVLLALLGGALGVLLAAHASKALIVLASDPASPLRLELAPDWRILLFTIVVSMLAGVLFGLAPAYQAIAATSSPSRTQGRQSQRWGKTILVGQVALSVLLLTVAGLLVRTLGNLRNFDAGVTRDNVLLFYVLPDRAVLGRFRPMPFQDLAWRVEERLNTIPGIRSASLSTFPPFSGFINSRAAIVPGHIPQPGEDREVHQNAVTPRFFDTMGMRVLRGRGFGPQDTENSRRVVILNETAARFFFPNQDPIGHFLGFGNTFRKEDALEIVGVVNDAKHANLREEYRKCVYKPEAQAGDPFLSVEVRTRGDSMALVEPVRQALKEVKRDIVVRSVRTLEEQIDRTLIQERMFAKLCGAFGLLALVLACVGLYGAMSYAVVRRTSEIGIRMAIGARQGDVLGLILRETLQLVAIGAALGIPAAFAGARFLQSFLFGVKPSDPATLATSMVLMFVTGALAGYLPARRAARIDPIVALRHE